MLATRALSERSTVFGLIRKRDKRGAPRWTIDRFLAVYDHDKTVFLGRVEDLSVGGMCVVSNEVPPSERHLRLALEVLREDGGTDTSHLRCRVLWIRPEKNTELYRIGFAFSGNSPAVETAIERLINAQSLALSSPAKPG